MKPDPTPLEWLALAGITSVAVWLFLMTWPVLCEFGARDLAEVIRLVTVPLLIVVGIVLLVVRGREGR